jgi:DNA-binding transcriptional LysR family regulator
VLKDELVLIASPDHPIVKKGKVGVRDLAGESFIAHTVTSQSRQKVVEAFRTSDTPLRIVMEVAMIETIKKLVAMKLGLAFIPEMSVQDEVQRGELVRVPVEGFQYERTLWLARRKTDSHSHAAQEFADMVLQKKN